MTPQAFDGNAEIEQVGMAGESCATCGQPIDPEHIRYLHPSGQQTHLICEPPESGRPVGYFWDQEDWEQYRAAHGGPPCAVSLPESMDRVRCSLPVGHDAAHQSEKGTRWWDVPAADRSVSPQAAESLGLFVATTTDRTDGNKTTMFDLLAPESVKGSGDGMHGEDRSVSPQANEPTVPVQVQVRGETAFVVMSNGDSFIAPIDQEARIANDDGPQAQGGRRPRHQREGLGDPGLRGVGDGHVGARATGEPRGVGPEDAERLRGTAGQGQRRDPRPEEHHEVGGTCGFRGCVLPADHKPQQHSWGDVPAGEPLYAECSYCGMTSTSCLLWRNKGAIGGRRCCGACSHERIEEEPADTHPHDDFEQAMKFLHELDLALGMAPGHCHTCGFTDHHRDGCIWVKLRAFVLAHPPTGSAPHGEGGDDAGSR